MNRMFKLFLIAAVGLFFVGCYNDYKNPKAAKIYTRADFEKEGLEYISIKELKAQFKAENSGMNDGAVASWSVDKPLFTSGKVISTDRYGNVYKSIYLYDEQSESAIELKLNTGNYLFHPVGQIVYVKLQNLVLGNYRGMISIGTRSSNTSYANDNIESKIMQDDHVFSGEQQPMLKTDTLVVTRENYTSALSDDDLGRLVRFEGVESKFGTALWGYGNTFPNYFANSTSFDINTPDDGNLPKWSDIDSWATWALKRRYPSTNIGTYFYGSAWFTYDAAATSVGSGNAPAGNYVVRTSGYSQFRDNKIPADGSIVDLTAIYTKFTNGSGNNAAYQLTLNTDRDVFVR